MPVKKKRRIRKSIIFVFVLLIVLACVFTGYMFYRDYITKPKANTILIFDFIENKEVYVDRENKTTKAYKGMRLKQDDSLYTNQDSKVYIKLDENKNILLDYNTRINIERYSNDQLIIKLVQGQFFFDVTSKLNPDEKMQFRIANTTMSIRGTSGAGINENGSGSLMIFSGKGEIESNNTSTNQNSLFTLLPSTKVSFEIIEDNTTSDIEVSVVSKENIPSVTYDYLNYSKQYHDELQDNNWDDTNPPTNLSGDMYVGFRQRQDGTWYFSKEDYENGIGPTPYLIEKPTNLMAENSIYNGQEQTPNIIGYNPNFMIIEGANKINAGTYDVIVKPRYKWLEGNQDPIILKWTILPKDIELKIENAKKEYKSKDPEFYSTLNEYEDIKIEYKLIRDSGEELGEYKIYPVWDKEKYLNYNIVYNEAYLSIFTSFNINPKENKYTYSYDGFYNGPDDVIEISDENGSVLSYSLDHINYQSNPIKVVDAGNYIVYVKASNPRYSYEAECTYEIEITQTRVEAKATGYYNQKSIDMIAEVQVPPGVEYTAAYYLYEINDFNLNREKATLISRIVANGTYIAYPQIQILDPNFIPDVKYTKVSVRSMLLHIFSNDYYDNVNDLLKTYSQE